MPQTAVLTSVEARSLIGLWHLLSLDAPTVATLWLVFVARETYTVLPPLLAPAMFLAVWLIYAADRLLETEDHQPRHNFHQQHRTAFLTAMVAAALTLSGLLAEIHLPHAYLPLAFVFLAWFAVVHLTAQPLPKELATGLIFAAAIFAPELVRHWSEALAFALLCTVNCAWINRWEAPSVPQVLLPRLTATLLLLALTRTPIAAAIALSAAALLALNHYRQHLHPTTLRAAADLALLTPILFLAR